MASVLRELRDFVPIRALVRAEAFDLAERQAEELLRFFQIAIPPVPEDVVTKIPRIEVKRMVPWPVAGASQWSRGRWLIVINGADNTGRQRFTLAHEFKHVLDDPFVKSLYPPLHGMTSHDRAEAVCDYFAGALLVPQRWLVRSWHGGLRDVPSLARKFDVSRQAIQVRLQQVGLVETRKRHLSMV